MFIISIYASLKVYMVNTLRRSQRWWGSLWIIHWTILFQWLGQFLLQWVPRWAICPTEISSSKCLVAEIVGKPKLWRCSKVMPFCFVVLTLFKHSVIINKFYAGGFWATMFRKSVVIIWRPGYFSIYIYNIIFFLFSLLLENWFCGSYQWIFS